MNCIYVVVYVEYVLIKYRGFIFNFLFCYKLFLDKLGIKFMKLNKVF